MTEPEALAFCCQLWCLTLEREVTFMEKGLGKQLSHGMTPYSLSRVLSDRLHLNLTARILVDIPAGNWDDHMVLIEGLAGLEPESTIFTRHCQCTELRHHASNISSHMSGRTRDTGASP